MFFWKKPKEPKRPVRATITEQHRRDYRASVEFPLLYVVAGRPGTRTAVANDLSAGGLRLIGDEDFADGAVIDIRFTLPNDMVRGVQLEKEIVEVTARGRMKKKIMVPPDPFREMHLRAKVVIAFLSVKRRKFAHGVQFVDVDERNKEEVQRFIHVWQMRLLRERAHMRGE